MFMIRLNMQEMYASVSEETLPASIHLNKMFLLLIVSMVYALKSLKYISNVANRAVIDRIRVFAKTVDTRFYFRSGQTKNCKILYSQPLNIKRTTVKSPLYVLSGWVESSLTGRFFLLSKAIW